MTNTDLKLQRKLSEKERREKINRHLNKLTQYMKCLVGPKTDEQGADIKYSKTEVLSWTISFIQNKNSELQNENKYVDLDTGKIEQVPLDDILEYMGVIN